jgi:hypothetical protein
MLAIISSKLFSSSITRGTSQMAYWAHNSGGFLKITIAFCSLVVAIIAVVTEIVHLFRFK